MSLPPPPPTNGPSSPRRGGVPRWVWVAVPVAALVVLAGLTAVLLVLLQGSDEDEVRATYEAWNQSQDGNDCDLYESATTAQYRDDLAGGSYACEDWKLPFDNWIDEVDFEYEISSIEVDGDTAVLVVDESFLGFDPEGQIDTERLEFDNLVYQLVKTDGEWVLDGVPSEYTG